MAEKAYITPEILEWARLSAKISLEKAAAVISKSCTPDKIKEWESTDCQDFPTISQVKNVATDIRKTLGIIVNEGNTKPLKYWIEKAGAQRIFISLSSNFHNRLKLDSEEVKGFAIADKNAPFIFLNSEDWENAQLFTLV